METIQNKTLPSDTDVIRYMETDLSSLRQSPCHFECGIYLVCVRGTALVSTGAEQYTFDEQTELIFLTGSLMHVLNASDDFRARVLLFPKAVFLTAMLPIDTPYFNYTHEHPCYRHTPDDRSQKTWREINLWMDVAQMLFAGTKPQFRQLQEANFMQSLLLWLFGTIPEKVSAGKSYSRKQMVCYRFMQLVREYGTREHRVEFYADRLCITPRYLHRAMVEHWGGKSPKLLIDEQLVAEVKVLLADPALSVTEIAQRLNFVDQSYLSRFFKKYTGLSPKEYRAQGFVFF